MNVEHKTLVEALDVMLAGCAFTPAAAATFGGEPIPPDARLPQRLEQLLSEFIAHPEYEPQAIEVMSNLMQDFGARVFRRMLIAGLRRGAGETNLAQNKRDVLSAVHLLMELAAECHNTPLLPKDTGDLLSRIANALHDLRWTRNKPTLFEDLAPEGYLPSDTAGNRAEGRLAAALEIVMRGGLKLAEAKAWMGRELEVVKLVDEASNPVSGARVASWRNNFRKSVGARSARTSFEFALGDCRSLLEAPAGEQKRVMCEEVARRLIDALAAMYNRTIPRAVNRRA